MSQRGKYKFKINHPRFDKKTKIINETIHMYIHVTMYRFRFLPLIYRCNVCVPSFLSFFLACISLVRGAGLRDALHSWYLVTCHGWLISSHLCVCVCVCVCVRACVRTFNQSITGMSYSDMCIIFLLISQ